MDQAETKKFVKEKLNAGVSLSDIQKELAAVGANMTYLDLRMLASELEVDWEKQRPKPVPAKKKAAADDLLLDDELDGGSAGTGHTEVTVSKLVRPGAAMSGDVTFASGAKAEWVLDSYGRLGLNPAPGSGKPTEADIQEFQVELQRKLTQGA